MKPRMITSLSTSHLELTTTERVTENKNLPNT